MFNLAQVNVTVAKFSVDDPLFAGFIDNLDRINAIADRSPGFVWRYQSDDCDAEAKRIFANEALIFNMSLWESADALRHFVYESDHIDILRRRGEWFVPQRYPVMALWWQPVDQFPSVAEGKHRLDCLAERGATQEAFTFRNAFDAPDAKRASAVPR